MKTEKERKRLSIFKVETKDVFITDDGKKFYDKEEADNWEWYLNNKSRIIDEYKFSDVSPMYLGLHYIVDPFNPAMCEGLKTFEVKKDALMLLNWIEK